MRTLPTVLLLSCGLAAQSHVSHPHFTAVEGTSNSSLPFGSPTVPLRYQQVHDGVPAMTIQRLAFRHETNGTIRVPYDLTVSVSLSTATTTAATASADFAANHGPDLRQVVAPRTFTVPANDPAALPGAFVFELPFDTGQAFVFTGNGASLCWEVQVAATTSPSTVLFDAVLVQSVPTLSLLAGTIVGTGCLSTGRTQPMRLAPANSPTDWALGTGAFRANATQLLGNGAIAWIAGLDTTQSGGQPLPYVLPTSVGAPSGPCTVRLDALLLDFAVASASGTAVRNLPFVPDPSLHGTRIAHQVLGFDAAANPIGVTASGLALQQIVAPDPAPPAVARVYTAGSLGATGTLDRGNCLVVRFD